MQQRFYTKLFSLVLLLMVSFSLSLNLCADPYKIVHLYNSNKQQDVYLFADCHLATDCSAAQQDALILQARAKDAHLIVEDMAAQYVSLAYPEEVCTSNYIKKYLADHSFGDFLSGLTIAADMENVRSTNIECRCPELLSSGDIAISAAQAYAALNKEIERVATYSDGIILKKYYAEKVEKFNRFKKKFHTFFDKFQRYEIPLIGFIFNDELLREQTMDMVKNCLAKREKMSREERDAALRSLQYVPSSSYITNNDIKFFFLIRPFAFIIDIKILHEIYSRSDRTIFVCAGGAHTQKVYEQLLLNGYEEVFPNPDYASFNASGYYCSDYFVQYSAIDIASYFVAQNN